MKQIYTGYKWRPMNPEEIEIMDATRLRPFKLEDPEAGDIYEGVSGMTEFEKMQTLSPDELAIFIYLHSPEFRKGLKKITAYINSEYVEGDGE